MTEENIPSTFIANGKEIPLKTPEDIEAKKSELDKQLADGLIDGATYNQKLIDLRMPYKYKVKPHKKFQIRYLIILLVVIFLCSIPAAIFINWQFYFKNTLSAAGVPDFSNTIKSSLYDYPIQINLSGYSETGEYKDRPISITYKAYYDITGIVVSTRDYWGFDAYNTLAPRDLCMIYGDLARDYPKKKSEMNFRHTERMCQADGSGLNEYTDGVRSGAFGSTHYGVSLISNNHLIPSTAEVRNTFLGFSVGDIVRVVGYLVHVEYDDIILDSSMTRDDIMYDHSSTTCEIIYVTKAEKIGHESELF